MDGGNQAVLIATNIEDGFVVDLVSAWKQLP
jgi:hypothetical protein